MKVILLTFLLFIFDNTFSQSSDIDQWRQLYVTAHQESSVCQRLYNLTENSDLNTNVLAYSYHAIANMLLGKFAYNPSEKWRYFKTGKTMLEKAISQNPNNIELRFLRYCVQINSPFFLAYRSHIDSDKEMIIQHIDNQTEPLQSFIKPIFNQL